MTDAPDPDSESKPDPEENQEDVVRCPSCDFVVQPGQDRCLMCGDLLPLSLFQTDVADEPATVEVQSEVDPVSSTQAEDGTPVESDSSRSPHLESESEASLQSVSQSLSPEEDVVEPQTYVRATAEPKQPFADIRPIESRSTRSTALVGMTVLFALITLAIGAFAFFNPDSIPIVLIASPTPQEVVLERPTASPTPTSTPTFVPLSLTPTMSPTVTNTPFPTSTPQPPRGHTLESGQTLVGVAVLYGITLDSILSLNNFTTDSIVFEGQDILIPWPTPTPPLQPIVVTIGAETIVVDPSNCPPFHTIEEGENLFFLASRNDVPLQALLEMNFLNIDSIVQPGDVICIPDVVERPALIFTPGPSPTPGPTMTPSGPKPLLPVDVAEIDATQTLLLQWLPDAPLAEDEYFMIEIIDLTNVDAHPQRAFTRATSLFITPDLFPSEPQAEYSWNVSRVKALDLRADGSLIYSPIGVASEVRTFVVSSQ